MKNPALEGIENDLPAAAVAETCTVLRVNYIRAAVVVDPDGGIASG